MKRWWIVILAVVVVLALVAGVGHFGLGWWRPLHATTSETAGGYDSDSKPATLSEALAVARQSLDEIERNVRDYSAVIVQEEQIGTQLIKTVMFAKVREEPFSVYLYFLDRSDKTALKREVVYVQGRNKDNLIVHTPGVLDMFGKMTMAPNSLLATQGEHYPITEIGLANLCRQLIKRGEAAGDPSRVTVKRFRHARINTRICTLLEITYPVDEPKKWGYLARVFVDDEFHFPIRAEVYELPLDRGKGPQLVEGYTYLDVKLNNGYTDADFDPKNPQYKFP